MTEHRPRFLAPSARRPPRVDESLGFTDDPHQAMRDEPECVSDAIVNVQTELAAKYSALRHAAWVEQAREDRKSLTLGARMADIRRRAKARRADHSLELHTIGKMIERGNRAAAEIRITRLEAILDGPIQIP